MKVTCDIPNTWIELQEAVCKYLNEAGYSAESPKTIQTVRGKIEVDVYAVAKNELIRTFICECKHWSTAVPKEKVHAFRTAVHDSGATLGILIAKSGFQSGAIEAAQYSNVLLKDWEGFLGLIERQWTLNKLVNLRRIAHPLSVYTDPLDIPYNELSQEKREEYNRLTLKYTNLYLFGRQLNISLLQKESLEINGIVFSSCSSLFAYLEKEYLQAISEYNAVFEGCTFDTYKFEFSGYMLFELMDDIFDGRIEL